MGKLTSLTAGVMVGAVVGMMVIPNLDRKTQRAFKKAGKRVVGMAEDSMAWK